MLLALLSLVCCADSPKRRVREAHAGSVAGVVVGIVFFTVFVVVACLFCAGAFQPCCRGICSPPSTLQLLDSPPEDDVRLPFAPPIHVAPGPSPEYADGWGAPCQYQPVGFPSPSPPATGLDPAPSGEPVPDATHT
jgi:hypothetical protein